MLYWKEVISFIVPLRKIYIIFLGPNYLLFETLELTWKLKENTNVYSDEQVLWQILKQWRYQSGRRKGYVTSTWTFCQNTGPEFNFWVNSIKLIKSSVKWKMGDHCCPRLLLSKWYFMYFYLKYFTKWMSTDSFTYQTRYLPVLFTECTYRCLLKGGYFWEMHGFKLCHHKAWIKSQVSHHGNLKYYQKCTFSFLVSFNIYRSIGTWSGKIIFFVPNWQRTRAVLEDLFTYLQWS